MDTNVRPETMARITTPELAKQFIEEQVAAVRAQVGDKKVLLALSGGVPNRYKVTNESLIKYGNSRYSVDPKLIGEEVTVDNLAVPLSPAAPQVLR